MMSDGVSRHGGASGVPPGGGACVVRAAPVTESSLMESVAGFISEVQTFHQSSHNRDGSKAATVTWARFEKTDLNDQSIFPESLEINGNFSQHDCFCAVVALCFVYFFIHLNSK